ncbi:MAG: 2-oxoglutarate dehydrogenase E2 component (dihydrolipoamide succinyltransferase), partial [Saprospiraceae bacterium]
MAKIELIMPKMGESIMEATILGWLKQPGDAVEMDEPILEIATDKVDSEVPSPVDGVIQEVFFEVDDVVEVGKVIAIISTEAIAESTVSDNKPTPEVVKDNAVEPVVSVTESNDLSDSTVDISTADSDRFYSPLVRSIAQKEGISIAELETISGSGNNDRVTKD